MNIFRLVAAILLILLGISILTGASFFKYAFALLIIYIGLRLLLNTRPAGYGRTVDVSEDRIDEVIIFSAGNKLVKSGSFRGGRVASIFAGEQIDLSQVTAAENDIKLELTAIFGGIKVIVPKTWKVKSEGTAIFGGYDNKTGGAADGVVLMVKGTAVFGGVEIVS